MNRDYPIIRKFAGFLFAVVFISIIIAGIVFEDISLIVSALAAFFLGLGFLLNWEVTDEDNKTRQVQLFNDSFNNLDKKVVLFYTKFKDRGEAGKKEWYDLYFNSIDVLALYINEGHIKDKKLVGFFNNKIIVWYEAMFLENHAKEEIENTSLYPEFEKLYHKVKKELAKNNAK